MQQVFISLPLFLFLSVFQSVAVSRIRFLSGFGDLVLLAIVALVILDEESNHLIWGIVGGFFISIISAMPYGSTFAVYITAAVTAKLASRLFWQSPIIALFSSAGIATVLKFVIELVTLQFLDIPAPFGISIASVLLPTLLINLFLSFPAYILIEDLLRLLSPKDEKYA